MMFHDNFYKYALVFVMIDDMCWFRGPAIN